MHMGLNMFLYMDLYMDQNMDLYMGLDMFHIMNLNELNTRVCCHLSFLSDPCLDRALLKKGSKHHVTLCFPSVSPHPSTDPPPVCITN